MNYTSIFVWNDSDDDFRAFMQSVDEMRDLAYNDPTPMTTGEFASLTLALYHILLNDKSQRRIRTNTPTKLAVTPIWISIHDTSIVYQSHINSFPLECFYTGLLHLRCVFDASVTLGIPNDMFIKNGLLSSCIFVHDKNKNNIKNIECEDELVTARDACIYASGMMKHIGDHIMSCVDIYSRPDILLGPDWHPKMCTFVTEIVYMMGYLLDLALFISKHAMEFMTVIPAAGLHSGDANTQKILQFLAIIANKHTIVLALLHEINEDMSSSSHITWTHDRSFDQFLNAIEAVLCLRAVFYIRSHGFSIDAWNSEIEPHVNTMLQSDIPLLISIANAICSIKQINGKIAPNVLKRSTLVIPPLPSSEEYEISLPPYDLPEQLLNDLENLAFKRV